MDETYKQTLKAAIIACAGWLAFNFVDAGSKLLTQNYGVAQILVVTNLIGVLLAGVILYFQHGWKGFLSRRWRWHVLRGFTTAIIAFSVISALSTLPLADFYGIVFLSPILVNLLSHFYLREYVGVHRLGAAVIGFAGVLIIAGPQFETYSIGLMFAFIVALAVSINAMIIRKTGREDPILLFALYPFAFNLVFQLPFALQDFQPVLIGDIWLFLLVPVFVMCGHSSVSYAYAHVREIAIISPFHYTQMIWGVMLGFLLFGDIPSLPTIAGSLIIAGCGLYVIYREHLQYKRNRQYQEDMGSVP